MDLVDFYCNLSSMMFSTVQLSVFMGVAGCGWPISNRLIIIDTLDLLLWNNGPISASAADDILCFIILERIRIDQLVSLMFLKSFDLSKNFPRRYLMYAVMIGIIHRCGCEILCH